ncbi:hypothetical protein LUZ60_005250 [Juncus effusus]|nr:hypothetical protein LUZ60_005250 [Juncus effusus]
MDLLKKELQRKRQALAADFGGKKLLRRSEIEQKEIQKLRQDEQRSLAAKSSSSSHHSTNSESSSNPNSIPSSSEPNPNNSKPDSSSSAPPIDELILPRHEVIRRLRILKQPITLFGEDDAARLERYKLTLKSGVVEIDSDMSEGQTNDFLRDISELRKRQKSGTYLKDKKEMDAIDEGEGDERDHHDLDLDEGLSVADKEKDLVRMKTSFLDLCDEDKILVFFKKLLNEWNQELHEMTDKEKRSAKGKSIVATFKQCARYLTPLFKFCRKKVLQDDIRQALLVVVNRCMDRDYLAAMDQYIKLSIGNAPWPIGVTMVGIHERSAREKIHTNSVAHIMNDETTRKYLQSVKRLMTFCQRKYPSVPSKSVEFNSLANGSDLQALLAEERKGGAGGGGMEEMLRLMPAGRE